MAGGRRQLLRYYRSQLQKGHTPSPDQLRTVARTNRWPWPGREFARSLRFRFQASAVRERPRKVRAFSGPSYERFGILLVDLAHFLPRHAGVNGGMSYFFLGAESLSQRLSVKPTASKTSADFAAALRSMLADFDHEITHVLSDRESALTSARFQREFKKDYDVNFIQVATKSKSNKAERLIQYVKRRLSIAIEARVEAGRKAKLPGWKMARLYRWVDLLPGLVREYNAGFVPGTKIRRKDVSRANSLRVLGQILETDKPQDLLTLNATTTNPNLPLTPQLRAKLFRYKLGQAVLLAREADYTRPTTFVKKSTEGAFGDTVYLIRGQSLKTNRDRELIPVYQLKRKSDGRPLLGFYYQRELVPALYADGEEVTEDDEEKRGGNRGESSEEEEAVVFGGPRKRKLRRSRRVRGAAPASASSSDEA